MPNYIHKQNSRAENNREYIYFLSKLSSEIKLKEKDKS